LSALSAPAALRNRGPIGEVLREVLPDHGLVLEIAAGTGEHAVHFARMFPHLEWQPSDPDAHARDSIRAWRAEADLPNLLEPVALDASALAWPIDAAQAMLCINMVHISPWGATAGLMRGAGRILPHGAPLILYGPYRRSGVATAPSNEAFDASLKSRNPDWGLRELGDVEAEARRNGLAFERLFEMPANNLTILFRKS
jgi:SAM-dependent methyltransferase